MEIEFERLKTVHVDRVCDNENHDNIVDCAHNITIEYKDGDVIQVGKVKGMDIFLFLSQLINNDFYKNEEELKSIYWDHFLPQKKQVVFNAIQNSDLAQLSSLIESNDIPKEYPSVYVTKSIQSNNLALVKLFKSYDFDLDHPGYYRVAIQTRSSDMINFVINSIDSVKKILLKILLDGLGNPDNGATDVFAFLTKNYHQHNIFTEEILDVLCSTDVYYNLVVYVEENAIGAISNEYKKKWITPISGSPFITFWVNEGEKQIPYLGKLDQNDKTLKNPKITVFFSRQVLNGSNLKINL